MAPMAEAYQLPTLERLGYHESPPPFINGLIQNREACVVFSQSDFHELVQTADARTSKLLADQMNRQIDTTGFVSEFIGRCTTPEEVQSELGDIALKVLLKLQQESPELQDDVHRLLIATPTTPIEYGAFLWLDKQHGEIMDDLAQKRTPEAELFRKRTEYKIKQTPNTDVMYIPEYSTPPIYAYHSDVNLCHLVTIQRFIHIPSLPVENRELLEQLTPTVFKRETDTPDHSPNTIIGFMQQFRKAGDPLARALAQKLKEKTEWQRFAEDHIDHLP